MGETMLAARFHGVGEGLRVEEVPVPEPGPGEALVKVEACGICLSDVHLLDGTLKATQAPITPGHEAFGIVASVGDRVRAWAPGERAVMHAGRSCGQCPRCSSGRLEECLLPELMAFNYDGAWAEYVVVPDYVLSRVPDGIPAEQAAILADAVATPFGALVDTAKLVVGETVGLWGIGGLGAHAVQLARLMGAGLVVAVDPRASARERALGLGADLALDPADPELSATIWEATGGTGLDVAMDLVGANAVLKQALRCVGQGGRVVIVGLSGERVELGPSVLHGTMRHAILGHLGYTKAHLDTLVRLLAAGRLDLSGSVSDVITLADIAEGVRRIEDRDEDIVRLVVRP
jgi:D-arabinose 1-dehydrogenase-like Zn-dependent alcohol dehydrogenase